MITISGTGHRPDKLGGYTNKAFLNLVSLAECWLNENKVDRVISGMALGWDQALAQGAFNCNIPFTASIPFLGQEKNWSDKCQKYFKNLLEKADDIVYVCEPGYAPYKMQKRNEWMVDNSDIVLTVWDGSKGGTYNCLQYAQSKGKEIINLFEKL